MRFLIPILFLMSQIALATEATLLLKTPRGADVNVTLHVPVGANLPAIVVAPGRNCNSKGSLFETLGRSGAGNGVAIIRFEWHYCNENPVHPSPSPNLRDEIEDFQTVLNFAKSYGPLNSGKITIAGKSLGSIVAYAVFGKNPAVKTLVLLTPVCSHLTDDNGATMPEPQNVCEENYPGIKNDPRPILMTMGSRDGLCLLPILYDFLKDSRGNISTVVAGGDHAFSVRDDWGNQDPAKTGTNIDTVVQSVLNWRSIHE